MSLNALLKLTDSPGSVIECDNGGIFIKGAVNQVLPMVKRHKSELLRVLQGDIIDDVGRCEGCGDELIGFSTFDGYIYRTCPECGLWFTCVLGSSATLSRRQPLGRVAGRNKSIVLTALTLGGQGAVARRSRVLSDLPNENPPRSEHQQLGLSPYLPKQGTGPPPNPQGCGRLPERTPAINPQVFDIVDRASTNDNAR